MSSLQTLLTSAQGLSARPDSIMSLLEIIEDPVVDVEKLLPIVDHDPGLTAGLLKLCNSPLYNYNRSIGSPRDALVMVGNLTFARLCFTLCMEPVLNNELPGYDQDLDDLWKHSLATAYGAGFLVKTIGMGELRDRAFTAGLLHDIGKLVLDPAIAENKPESCTKITMDIERQCCGYDHAEAGAALLESWNVPTQIVSAVRWSHSPLEADEHKRLALAVSVANQVGNFAVHFNSGSENIEQWVETTFKSSSFPLDKIGNLVNLISAKRQNIMALAMGQGL